MKIACDSCGAKYTIADEKVSGKTVKIRCKKCGATMVIDGHGAGAASPVSVSSPPPGAPLESGAMWMIHAGEGAQETVSPGQIVERYRDGRIDGSAYVWREGMADWKALRDVQELFTVCVASVGAAPPQGAARPVESARRASARPPAEPVSSRREPPPPAEPAVQAAPAPKAAQAAARERGPLADLVSSSATNSSAPEAPQAVTGQRNDTSVLFSLASLAQNAPAAAPPEAPGSDASGLIDMRALAQIAPKPAVGAPKVEDIMNLSAAGLFGGGAVSPVMTQTYQAVHGPGAGLAPAPSGGVSAKVVGLAVGGGLLTAALIGVGLFFALRKPEPPPTVSVAAPPSALPAPEQAPSAAAAAPVLAAGAPVAPNAPAAGAERPATAGGQKSAPTLRAHAAPSPRGGVSSTAAAAALFGAGGVAKSSPAPAPAASPQSLETAMLASAARAGAPHAAPPKPVAAAASGAPFDRGAASAELKRITEAAAACRRASGPSGDGHVTVTFRNDGSVDHVEVDRPPFQGTSVGACVASKYKLARVPAFGGAPITVGKSFAID